MIEVSEANRDLTEGPRNAKELYEAMRLYLGFVVLVRHRAIERSGVLNRLSYDRDDDTVYYSFDSEDRIIINPYQRVEVLIDGAWKLVNRGHSDNWEL